MQNPNRTLLVSLVQLGSLVGLAHGFSLKGSRFKLLEKIGNHPDRNIGLTVSGCIIQPHPAFSLKAHKYLSDGRRNGFQRADSLP